VKSIVDLHDGAARIESEVNRGTTITLIFPNKSAAL
jgi:signal transduction histidine kinase